MNFVVAAKTSDLAKGEMKAIDVSDTKVVLANVDGEIYAIQAACPHMGADLSKGALKGHVLTCAKHGAGFDVRDGSAVDPAKVLFLKMKTKGAQCFPVKVEGDQVLVAV